MSHTVVKLGGSVLTGPGAARTIRGILDEYEGPLVVVVSALKGVTDELVEAARRSARRDEALVASLRERHRAAAVAFGSDGSAAGEGAPGAGAAADAAFARIDELLSHLDGLLACPASRRDRQARILAIGERLSAACVAVSAVAALRPGPVIEPGRLGLRARGTDRDATVDIAGSAPSVRAAVDGRDLVVVPGFYGAGPDGAPLLFGRGGSDYSAAAIAACLGARSCDLVKDVPGLFARDPALEPGARPIGRMSYAEAAALAASGARVLHPRCVAPLAAARVPLRVRSASLAEGMTVVGPGPGSAARAALAQARRIA